MKKNYSWKKVIYGSHFLIFSWKFLRSAFVPICIYIFSLPLFFSLLLSPNSVCQYFLITNFVKNKIKKYLSSFITSSKLINFMTNSKQIIYLHLNTCYLTQLFWWKQIKRKRKGTKFQVKFRNSFYCNRIDIKFYRFPSSLRVSKIISTLSIPIVLVKISNYSYLGQWLPDWYFVFLQWKT